MIPSVYTRCSRLPWIVGLSVGIAALLPIACAASPSSQQQGNVIRFVRNPEAAPDFKLNGLDGKALTLAGSRGKVTLLNFWATWCGPCQAEIPDLIALQQKYKDQLQIIGLIVDEDDASAVKQVVAETQINYPVAMTPPEVRIQYGGISALPTSFVLDAQGRIVQKHEGLRDPALYETEIRALLGLPINARVEQKQVALHKFNAEGCTCGCKFTLAQCRIYDRSCAVSKSRTAKIVADLSRATPP